MLDKADRHPVDPLIPGVVDHRFQKKPNRQAQKQAAGFGVAVVTRSIMRPA